MNEWLAPITLWAAVVGACIAVPGWIWVGWEVYKQRKQSSRKEY